MNNPASQNIIAGTGIQGAIFSPRRFLMRCAILAVSLIALALPARATVLGVSQCSDTSFTIQLQGFPNAAITVQLLLSGTATVVLDTTYNFAAQTLVAVRPAGLAGGTYQANFYVNGVWFTQDDMMICNTTGGGGGGGTNVVSVGGVTQCNDSSFTLGLQNFPNAAIVVQLLGTASGDILLDTTFNVGAQTLVAVRPAGLVGGTYKANFYANGVWIAQANLNICNLSGGGGGGGGGTGGITVTGVTQCNDSSFTLGLQNFPNAAIVVQLLGTASGDILLDSTFNAGAQTLVAVRPAGLVGGTYKANFYANGVWIAQADLNICNLGGGGGGGGTGGISVTGVTQCNDSSFTLGLQNFPNAAIVVQLLGTASGDILLDTSFNVGAQTLVAVRPAGLVGGTYKANFYANGVWIAQADLNICNLGAGGGGGGTGGVSVTGVTQCNDSNFTIGLQNFPSGVIVVQLLGTASGDILLDTTLNVGAQTLVAVRPAGLAGGTYKANFYVNGAWVAQADLVICNIGAGGGGGGTGGTPGGRTPGFWGNKNGQALITSADLAGLTGLCLRTSSGADFNASSKTSLATWMQGSTAVNMAYKLSVQLASTWLGVQHGFTKADVVVDGSLTVVGLIEYGNSLLCADGNTPAGDPNRAEQERVKDILDRINNGGSF